MSRASHSRSDADYIAAQAKDSSWSSQTEWGEAAAKKFIEMGNVLKATGQLFHDDTIADFGGNDGFAAQEFFLAHAIKPLVVDCEPQRIEHARTVYGLSTYEAFIEDMRDLEDKSIDWGFCSHTMEHTRDTAAAFREIARVIKRGCLFVLPIEDEEHAELNQAHACHADSLKEWKAIMLANGWKIKRHGARRPIRAECYIMGVPR